jgi:hypothetical protein
MHAPKRKAKKNCVQKEFSAKIDIQLLLGWQQQGKVEFTSHGSTNQKHRFCITSKEIRRLYTPAAIGVSLWQKGR